MSYETWHARSQSRRLTSHKTCSAPNTRDEGAELRWRSQLAQRAVRALLERRAQIVRVVNASNAAHVILRTDGVRAQCGSERTRAGAGKIRRPFRHPSAHASARASLCARHGTQAAAAIATLIDVMDARVPVQPGIKHASADTIG